MAPGSLVCLLQRNVFSNPLLNTKIGFFFFLLLSFKAFFLYSGYQTLISSDLKIVPVCAVFLLFR